MIKWILAVIGVVVIATMIALSGSGNKSIADQVGLTTPSSTSTTPPRTDCREGHVITMAERGDNHQLVKGGVPEQFRNNPEGFRTYVRDLAHRDPVLLFNFYEASPLQKVDPVNGPAELVENGDVVNGNCYSERGVRAFNEWWVHWKTADIIAVQQISHTGTNTGVSGTTPTYSSGVSGTNQSGFDVTYRDGNSRVIAQHSVLNRCDQVTHPGKLQKPEGPTDNNPPPPGATTSTTNRPGVTTTAPPGNTTTTQPPATTTTTRPGSTTTTTQPPATTTTTPQYVCPDGPLRGQPVPPSGVCPKDAEVTVNNPTTCGTTGRPPCEVVGPGTTPVGTPPPPPDPPDTHNPNNPDVINDGYCQTCPQPTGPPATTAPPITAPPVTAPPVTSPPDTRPPNQPTNTGVVVSR